MISIQPAAEVLLMPLFALLADRIGAMRALAIGASLGIGANVLFATSTSVVPLFAGQLFAAGMWAALAGLGVVIAQDIYPRGVGVASTMFFSAMSVGSTLGGLIGRLGVAGIGLPRVFWVPALTCMLATAGLMMLGSRHRYGTGEP